MDGGDGSRNTVVGIYIDISGGTWEQSSVLRIEETPTGRVVIMDVSDPQGVRIISTYISGPELDEVMRMASVNRRRIA